MGTYWSNLTKGKPLYSVWHNLKNRCRGYHPSDVHSYYDRGITFDNAWLTYQAFEDDVLPLYEEARKQYGNKVQLLLDRIDVDGNYELSNLRFVSPRESSWNKTDHHWITYNELTLTISQWAGMYQINRNTLIVRLGKGWTTERALNEPPQKGHTRS